MNAPVCYELVISARDDEKEAVTSLLNDLGETAFVEGSVDCDLEFDYEKPEQYDYYELNAKDAPIVLYSEDEARLRNVQERFREIWAARHEREIPMVMQPIADQNWRESWKASFKPVDVAGTFVILPPWENPAAFPHPHKIVIDPGMAFGTGQHETTRLCLEMLLEAKGYSRVFDVGTGSGILAIAARMLGAPVVFGCDIDPDSVEIARENSEKNGVTGIGYTATPLAQIAETGFDLVFANIQFKPLRQIMGEILKRTTPGGTVLISGILCVDAEEFALFLKSQGLQVLNRRSQGAWEGFFCRKPAG